MLEFDLLEPPGELLPATVELEPAINASRLGSCKC